MLSKQRENKPSKHHQAADKYIHLLPCGDINSLTESMQHKMNVARIIGFFCILITHSEVIVLHTFISL